MFLTFDLELALSFIFGTVSLFSPVRFFVNLTYSCGETNVSLVDNRRYWDVHICILTWAFFSWANGVNNCRGFLLVG